MQEASGDRQELRISAMLQEAGKIWPLLLAVVLLLVPACLTLANQVWNTELGAHGPIVLATGLWLLSTRLKDLTARRAPAQTWVIVLGLLLVLPIYTFGRAYDFISLEMLGVYGVALLASYRLYGWPAMRANLFPFGFLAFLIPPPGWVIDWLTVPLREFVSYVATHGLHHLGYPVANQGVSIMVAQYQLLVEDACAGMNSIVGLSAITLFYIYILHSASWRYGTLLAALIIPLAVVVNIARVVVLILLTYYAGDEVAQGFLHTTTGIALFAVALLGMMGLDAGLRFAYGRFIKRKAAHGPA
jgi:exosortase